MSISANVLFIFNKITGAENRDCGHRDYSDVLIPLYFFRRKALLSLPTLESLLDCIYLVLT